MQMVVKMERVKVAVLIQEEKMMMEENSPQRPEELVELLVAVRV